MDEMKPQEHWSRQRIVSIIIKAMVGAGAVKAVPAGQAADAILELLAPWLSHPAPTADAGLVDWMPIETAPKDGSTIDVWRDGTRETVYWGFPPHCCGEMGQYCDSDWHSEKDPGWVDSTFGEFVGTVEPFTHWMPLPSPPAALIAATQGEGG